MRRVSCRRRLDPAKRPGVHPGQGTTFLFSRCFIAGKDRFGCTTCHDPHRAVDTVSLHYEAKCLSCHSRQETAEATPRARTAAEHSAGHERACPVNPKAKCISCHMPKVEDPSRRSRFTDHHIRVHRDLARPRPAEAGTLNRMGRVQAAVDLARAGRSAIIESSLRPCADSLATILSRLPWHSWARTAKRERTAARVA